MLELKRAMTVPELARFLRVGRGKLAKMIRRGELAAVNVAASGCHRPRLVVLPQSLEEFVGRRSTRNPAKPTKRRKRTNVVDYYP